MSQCLGRPRGIFAAQRGPCVPGSPGSRTNFGQQWPRSVLLTSPTPTPTPPHTYRQKGEQENTGKLQEQDTCELARNFLSGAEEVCPEASHIQAELPPPLERLLIFNVEVCGFTICPSRQSQRASPRQRRSCLIGKTPDVGASRGCW